VFGVAVPMECPGVPSEILQPRNSWSDPDAYDAACAKLVKLFGENFATYEGGCSADVIAAGPRVAEANAS
jgi:phosphoenolpyruvate carboxykinase (ATP)